MKQMREEERARMVGAGREYRCTRLKNGQKYATSAGKKKPLQAQDNIKPLEEINL